MLSECSDVLEFDKVLRQYECVVKHEPHPLLLVVLLSTEHTLDEALAQGELGTHAELGLLLCLGCRPDVCVTVLSLEE